MSFKKKQWISVPKRKSVIITISLDIKKSVLICDNLWIKKVGGREMLKASGGKVKCLGNGEKS